MRFLLFYVTYFHENLRNIADLVIKFISLLLTTTKYLKINAKQQLLLSSIKSHSLSLGYEQIPRSKINQYYFHFTLSSLQSTIFLIPRDASASVLFSCAGCIFRVSISIYCYKKESLFSYKISISTY